MWTVVGAVVGFVVCGLLASWVVGPRPGAPRVVVGDTIPQLMPGEQATAQFAPGAFDEALTVARAALESGAAVPFSYEIKPTGALIGPAPGWRAWWARTEYRLYGWWLYGSVLYPLFGIGGPHVVMDARIVMPQGDR